MERMYQTYRDIADFRLVYISEAHAADSDWAVPYAKELGITNHKNYGQRCQTAEKLLGDKKLTIPTLIDNMDNEVNKAYKAHPDRIFVVRKDGKLAVAAKRGPWGFKPALNAAKTFLASYKETGKEPERVDPPAASTARKAPAPDEPGPDPAAFAGVLGDWRMTTTFAGSTMDAVMSLGVKDGKVVGVWKSRGLERKMSDLKFERGELSFTRRMGSGPAIAFKGTVTGDQVAGKYVGMFGELDCTGKRMP